MPLAIEHLIQRKNLKKMLDYQQKYGSSRYVEVKLGNSLSCIYLCIIIDKPFKNGQLSKQSFSLPTITKNLILINKLSL